MGRSMALMRLDKCLRLTPQQTKQLLFHFHVATEKRNLSVAMLAAILAFRFRARAAKRSAVAAAARASLEFNNTDEYGVFMKMRALHPEIQNSFELEIRRQFRDFQVKESSDSGNPVLLV